MGIYGNKSADGERPDFGAIFRRHFFGVDVKSDGEEKNIDTKGFQRSKTKAKKSKRKKKERNKKKRKEKSEVEQRTNEYRKKIKETWKEGRKREEGRQDRIY